MGKTTAGFSGRLFWIPSHVAASTRVKGVDPVGDEESLLSLDIAAGQISNSKKRRPMRNMPNVYLIAMPMASPHVRPITTGCDEMFDLDQ